MKENSKITTWLQIITLASVVGGAVGNYWVMQWRLDRNDKEHTEIIKTQVGLVGQVHGLEITTRRLADKVGIPPN